MKKTFITALLLVSFYLSTANSTTHRVIVGFGSDMVFSPQNISSAIVGDTIKWVWESGFHNTVSNTIPGGAASWSSLITSSDTVYSYVITVPGIYNYECTFHSGMTGSFTAAMTGLQQIGEIPISYSLSQNYPNPFNPVTKINFSIPKNNLVQLRIYDITGKEVAEIINRNLNSGEYSISYNAAGLTSGVYFYKLTTSDFSDIKKMMVIK